MGLGLGFCAPSVVPAGELAGGADGAGGGGGYVGFFGGERGAGFGRDEVEGYEDLDGVGVGG